jgi:hypothetical protein
MTDDVFEDLVNLYLDKEISPAQLSILRSELGRNSSRQKTFESYCRMHQATTFAALSACPVIPRLSHSFNDEKNKPAFFALNKQVWAAAVLIAVLGSFATAYFNGPFGSARIVQAKPSNLQKIETFVQATTAEPSEPPLEFFRDLKAKNQEWAYIQELRHARAASEFPLSQQQPSLYSWAAIQSEDGQIADNASAFDLEYSSYEFKR